MQLTIKIGKITELKAIKAIRALVAYNVKIIYMHWQKLYILRYIIKK